jgi:hypothetical protein
MTFKLSNQAIGAIMMALQKGILEQQDITTILQDFDLVEDESGLVVENPPAFKLDAPLEKETVA